MTSGYNQQGKSNIRTQLGDSQGNDGAGRQRVSSPLNLLSVKFEYSADDHELQEKIVGTGSSTHNSNESTVTMSVPAIGDEVIRQSHRWIEYQPGNSQETFGSFGFGPHEDGIVKEFFYASPSDGVVFRQANGTYYVVLRSSVTGSVVEQAIPQSEWSVDRMDGSRGPHNPSNLNVDFTKFTLEHIDLVWLGADRVRVSFKINGTVWDIHEFLNAGENDTTYMKSASLPVGYRIKNESGVGGGSMRQGCFSVRSEGGEVTFGTPHVAKKFNLPVTQATIAAGAVDITTLTPLLVVRPKSTYYNLPNRKNMRMLSFELLVKGNTPVVWSLLHDVDFAADPTYSPVAIDKVEDPINGKEVPSIAEFATGTVAANAITDWHHEHNAGTATADVKGDISGGGEISTKIILSRGTFDHTDNATADNYVLAVGGDGGAVASVTAILRWAEV